LSCSMIINLLLAALVGTVAFAVTGAVSFFATGYFVMGLDVAALDLYLLAPSVAIFTTYKVFKILKNP
jgi:hypothetical protein